MVEGRPLIRQFAHFDVKYFRRASIDRVALSHLVSEHPVGVPLKRADIVCSAGGTFPTKYLTASEAKRRALEAEDRRVAQELYEDAAADVDYGVHSPRGGVPM